MTNHGTSNVVQDHRTTDHSTEGTTRFRKCTHGKHMRRRADVYAASTFRNEANITLCRHDDDIEGQRCASETQANTDPPRRRDEADFRRSFAENSS